MNRFLSVFSPLQDDPLLRGEHNISSPFDWSKNQLTYAQGAYLHQWPVSFTPLFIGGATLGFFPMQDYTVLALGRAKTPFGPWSGDVPAEVALKAFLPQFGSMTKTFG